MLAVACFGAAGAGCGSPAHVLSGAGATTGAGRGGSGATNGGGGTTGCPQEVMPYCAGRTNWTCTTTWAAVLLDTSVCPLEGGFDDYRGLCGDFDVRELFGGGENDVYYDVSTGNLVAIWARVAGATGSCVAGPPDFAPPSCTVGALTRVVCPDGGAAGPDASPD